MNYTQITIGGKERGWKVNQLTIELWAKHIDQDASPSTSTYAAVYAGLVANCYVKREEPDFTFEDVCEWVDEINLSGKYEPLEKIKKTFEESRFYINLLDKLKDQLRTTTEEKKTEAS